MEIDFPAAHSMDTAWFAVDRDGHVARFSTGENGALPTEASNLDQVEDGGLELLPVTEFVPDLHGFILPGPFGEPHVTTSPNPSLERIALLLKSTGLVEKELATGRAVRLATADGEAIFFPRMRASLLEKIHQNGVCLMCIRLWRTVEPGPGLFRYDALETFAAFGANEPYGRTRVPRRPIHVDELPPRLRKLIGKLRMDSVCFAETRYIHPAEHARECHAYYIGAYLSSDGMQFHPLPGHDAEYIEYHAVICKALANDPRRDLVQVEEPAKKKLAPKRKKK